jgi:hypothetical protein
VIFVVLWVVVQLVDWQKEKQIWIVYWLEKVILFEDEYLRSFKYLLAWVLYVVL